MWGKLQQGGKALSFSPAPLKTFSSNSSKPNILQSDGSQLTTYQSTSAQSISPAQSFSPAQSPSPGQEPGALTATVPDQGKFTAGGLTRHVHEWSLITDDYITLQAVRGVLLPLTGKPPIRRPSQRELDERRVDQVIDDAIKVVVFSGLVLTLLSYLT